MPVFDDLSLNFRRYPSAFYTGLRFNVYLRYGKAFGAFVELRPSIGSGSGTP
jgi:hypothetical protein